MTNLKDWIVGERADKTDWCLIHIAQPACVIWLAGDDEDGLETDDPEIAIRDLQWLGEPGDADEIIEAAIDVLGHYDFP